MNMTMSDLRKLMEAEAKEKKIPLSGDFEITPRCNLNCVMCYVRKHPADKLAIQKEMSAEQIISIARQARDMGMLYILLTGGEILIRKDFKYIYEEIKNLGLIVTLYTNGTLITQEWVDWISNIPPLKVSITMYGASADTYKKVTGSGEAFYQVERAIGMLVEKGINVELKTTWIKSSVDDYYKLLEFAESKGLRLKVVNYIFPAGDNCSSNPLGHRLDPVDLVEKEIEIENYAYRRHIIDQNAPFEAPKSKERDRIIDNLDGNAFSCNAGSTTFWLTWSGEILPCGVMSEPKVALKNDDFKQAWVNLTEVVKKIPSCVTCNDCDDRKYCMTCPATLYAENGSFSEPAEYLCKHARTRAKLTADNFLKKTSKFDKF